jgi:RecA DNA recombination protein
MRAVLSKAKIESEVTDRLGTAFKLREKAPADALSTGILEVDAITGGLPRGAITEVFGSASSGRTSLMVSILAHATNEHEVCALVDTNNAFDPATVAGTGIVFNQLLWVRCGEESSNLSEGRKIELAFKAADLLLQSGGFGLVILDLADIPPKDVRRIISSWWFRFRRAVENTPTVMVVIAQASCVGSRASQALEMRKEIEVWTSASDTPALPDLGARKADILIPLFSYSIPDAPYSPPVVSPLSGLPPSPADLIDSRVNHSVLLRGLRLNADRQKPISFINQKVRYSARLYFPPL